MDPYNPPKHLQKPHDLFTSEERKEWLAWYDAGQAQRDKDNEAFMASACYSLFGSLLLIPCMWAIYEVVKHLEYFFVK